MQFLYPKVLWALFALAIPIIIHLFNFRRYKTVYFSNVAFLQNIRKETKSRSNIKNLLILISRLLALAFLVLVFAQPYIPTKKNTAVAENPFVAIYIDNSFSMDAEGKYGVLLETAKVKAKELTTVFPSNTKYLLVTNDFLLMHQRFVSSDQFVDWVAQIQSSHVVRNISEVLDKTSGLLPEEDTAVMHSVFLLTDFQKNTIPESFVVKSRNLKLYAMPFYNESKGNLYIDSLWFETPGHYKGKQENIYVRIQNISEESYNEIPLQLFINDSLKSSTVFNIEAFGTKELILPFVEWNSGIFKGHVELTDYPITFDNKLFFNFEIKEKKTALIINGRSAEKYLSILFKDDENIQATTINSDNIPFNTFINYQTIVLNELDNFSTGLVNEIGQYVNQGGTLLFVPSLEGDLLSYSLLFDKLKRIKITEFVEQEGNFSKIDLGNDLFKSSMSSDLKDVKYPGYKGFYQFDMQQNADVNVLYKSESGDPLFVQMPMGKGQFYLSALPLNSKITDLGVHPLFVPLFYNLVLYSSLPSELFYWIKPGLFNQFSRSAETAGSVSMIENLSGKEIKPKFNINLQDFTIYPEISSVNAGHYTITIGEVFQRYVSYNYDRAESNITYYKMSEIRDLFDGTNESNIEIVDVQNKNMAKVIQHASMGNHLSYLFLCLALLFLVVEMFLLKYLK